MWQFSEDDKGCNVKLETCIKDNAMCRYGIACSETGYIPVIRQR